MRSLVTCTAILACILVLTPVPANSQGNGLGRLRQDRLEIGVGMLEVQNVDWTTLLRYYSDDIEYHCPIVDVYGIEMVTEFLGRLYGSSPASNPKGPETGTDRVVRGGGWGNGDYYIRTSQRSSAGPAFQAEDFRFRCAQSTAP